MKVKNYPSKEEIRALFHINWKTGEMFWKERPPYSCVDVAKPAGSRDSKGYCQIGIQGGLYLRHRLLWIARYGGIPKGKVVDHRNKTPGDDRFSNLRSGSASDNMRNRKRPSTNKTGFKGVYQRSNGTFRVQVSDRNGKKTNLGSFKKAEEADSIARAFRIQEHGAFACHEWMQGNGFTITLI